MSKIQTKYEADVAIFHCGSKKKVEFISKEVEILLSRSLAGS